ncbi:MAG: MG2 domain-containing protein, partial [Pyrinomonadaceae bacterium]
MRRKIFLFFTVCTAFLLFLPILQAQSNYLRVDEFATRLFLREKTADVLLMVENPSANAADKAKAKVKIELISPNNETKAVAERDFQFEKGMNEIDFVLVNFAEIPKENFAFYRLRYEINSATQNINGIIAVSEIAPEIFEIEAIATENVRENQRYFVRTKAIQPVSLRGVENVQISGELGIEFENKKDLIAVRTAGVTDAQGYALLEFNLPPNVKKVDETSLKIIGSKNGLTREAEKTDVRFFESQFAYLQTDKPIYQPAQMLKVRTLFLNAANRALPAQDLVFVIKDPDDQVLQRIAARTSRFGVANAEWQIPENAKLGAYRLRVEDGIGGQYYNEQNFKVSRYELPNFTVNAKATAPFYLPEQKTATVEVSADYLFGQPVTKAKVRIVREESREWNYKEQ